MFAIFWLNLLYNVSKGRGNMIKICEICDEKFDTNSKTRIYCYKCSGDSTRLDKETRKHQKTILRQSMKCQACKLVCSNCHKEIHSKLGYKYVNDFGKCPKNF